MYEIEVKKKITVTVPAGKSYENTHKKDEEGNDIWDYISKPSYEKEEMQVIYKQQVESIDMLQFVAAVNGVQWK